MADIDEVKLRRLDVTTLMVFDGLMRMRKATRVAERLGLTQSSVSHALRRLRGVFDDELFLRRPHGLAPTAVAVGLEAPIRHALEQLHTAISGPAAFDPAAAAIVRLGASDYELATLAPALIGQVSGSAPGIRIVARTLVRVEALTALSDADLDLALGFFWRLPPEFIAQPLYQEDYVVVGRKGDAIMKQRLTLKRYADARHVLVSPIGALSGIVDEALGAQGLQREVIAATPLFFPALAIVAETGALVTAPRRFAERYARAFGLATAPPPLPIRSFEVSVVRHRRDARNSMHDWIIGLLQQGLG